MRYSSVNRGIPGGNPIANALVVIVGVLAIAASLVLGFFAFVVLGSIVLYACGVTWLKTLTAMPWPKAFAVGMLPFLIGDALKIVAAAAIAKAVRPIIRVTHNPEQVTQIS